MITNFTERNGKLRHDLTQQGSELAALRKSYLDYEVASREMTMYPGGDSTGDVLKFTSQLPAGAILGTPEIKQIVGDVTGIEYPVTGSPLLKKIQIVDLQTSKITSALGEYAWNGSKEVWYCDPVGIGFQDGFWTVKELVIEGKENFQIFMQGELEPDPEGFTSTRPDWCVGSPAFYYAEGLRNVIYNSRGELKTAHGTGKFAHPSRPYAMAWDSLGKPLKVQGQIVVVAGEWVETLLGIKKQFPQQAIQDLINAGAALISVDATLGNTTEGASSANVGTNYTWSAAQIDGYVPLSDVNVDSIHWYGKRSLGSGNAVIFSLHDKAAYPAITSYGYVPTAVCASVALDGTLMWRVGTPTGATAVTSANILWPTHYVNDTSSGMDAYFDDPGGSTGPTAWRAGTNLTTADVVGAQNFSGSQLYSTYLTITEGTVPPVTTNTTVVPTSQAQGGNVALSADGTDADHTITAAEYYIDSDPGEGSGTAMSLGAGTTTREATATIDTSGLSVAAHTVYVRMSDATDGWGAADSTALEITAAPSGPYTPTLILSESQLVGSWRIDQMVLSQPTVSIRMKEDRATRNTKLPKRNFTRDLYPLAGEGTIGSAIPCLIGKGLSLKAFLIDRTTNRFKVVDHGVVSFDRFVDEDGAGFIPDTIFLSSGEFIYTGWDRESELFADATATGENPVDAIEIILTDAERGANISSSRLDTTSTGKGFGSTGARTKYVRGSDYVTGDEKVDFAIGLYMKEVQSVEDWIKEVSAAAFGTVFVDRSNLWQYKAWLPEQSSDLQEIRTFDGMPRYTWKMESPVTRALVRYAEQHGAESVQAYEHKDDWLRQKRNLSEHASKEVTLPLSDIFSARYWAERTVATRGVPRRVLSFKTTQEHKELEIADFVRVINSDLQINTVFEVLSVAITTGDHPVALTLIDVRGFGDTAGFYADDADPAWDDTWTDDEVIDARENSAFWNNEGGYADTDDALRSWHNTRYV